MSNFDGMISVPRVQWGDPGAPDTINKCVDPLETNIDVLDAVLASIFNADGTQKSNVIDGNAIKEGDITKTKLGSESVTNDKVSTDPEDAIQESKLALTHSTSALKAAIDNLGQGSNYNAVLSKVLKQDFSSKTFLENMFGVVNKDSIFRFHTETGSLETINGIDYNVEDVVYINSFIFSFMGNNYKVFNVNTDSDENYPGHFPVFIDTPIDATDPGDRNKSKVNLLYMKMYPKNITGEINASNYTTILKKYPNVFFDMVDNGTNLELRVYSMNFEFKFENFSTSDTSEILNFLTDRDVPGTWSEFNTETNYSVVKSADGLSWKKVHDNDEYQNYYLFPVAIYTRGNDHSFNFNNFSGLEGSVEGLTTHLHEKLTYEIIPYLAENTISTQVVESIKKIMLGENPGNFFPFKSKNNEYVEGTGLNADGFHTNYNFFGKELIRQDSITKAGAYTNLQLSDEDSFGGDYIGKKYLQDNVDVDSGFFGLPISRVKPKGKLYHENDNIHGKDTYLGYLENVMKINDDTTTITENSYSITDIPPYSLFIGYDVSDPANKLLTVSLSDELVDLLFDLTPTPVGEQTEREARVAALQGLFDDANGLKDGVAFLDRVTIEKFDGSTLTNVPLQVGYTLSVVSGVLIDINLNVDTAAIDQNDIFYIKFPVIPKGNLGFNFPVKDMQSVTEAGFNDSYTDLSPVLFKEDIKYRNRFDLPTDSTLWTKIKSQTGNYLRFATNIDWSRDFPNSDLRSSKLISNVGIAMHPMDVYNSIILTGSETEIVLTNTMFNLPDTYRVTGINFDPTDLSDGITIDSVEYDEASSQIKLSLSGVVSATNLFKETSSAVVYFTAPLFDISIMNNGIKKIISYNDKVKSYTNVDSGGSNEFTFTESIIPTTSWNSLSSQKYVGPYDKNTDSESTLKGYIYAKNNTTGSSYYRIPIKKLEVLGDGHFVKVTVQTTTDTSSVDALVQTNDYDIRFIYPGHRLDTDVNTVLTYKAPAPTESAFSRFFFSHAKSFERITEDSFILTNLGGDLSNSNFLLDPMNLKNMYFNKAYSVSRADKDSGSFENYESDKLVVLNDIMDAKPINLIKNGKDVDILKNKEVEITNFTVLDNRREIPNSTKLKVYNINDFIQGKEVEVDKVAYNVENLSSNVQDYEAVIVTAGLVRNKVTRELKLLIAIDPILSDSYSGSASPLTSSSLYTQYFLSDLDRNYVI